MLNRAETTTIIPVAGGKGGVGKTLFTANLAIALAELGHATIVVDLDLGNSNLHSLLGLPNKFAGVGDFLRVGEGALEEYLVETEFPDLRFLPGDGRMPFMANITHAQKNQLIAKLKQLPARYILLDLGAGCAYHTLDFFAMAERGLVITTPEYPAVMSALVFLKNLVSREIERALPKDPELTDFLQEMYVQPMAAPQLTVETFREKVAAAHPEAAQRINEVCAWCRPRVVFNMGEHPDDLKWLQLIDRTVQQILGIQMDHFGFVFSDPSVRESVRQGKPLLAYRPESLAARNIAHIAGRIVRFWDVAIPNSAELLLQHTWKVYEEAHPKAEPAKEESTVVEEDNEA
jgi:flagellar biosynthesis protein FlhG